MPLLIDEMAVGITASSSTVEDMASEAMWSDSTDSKLDTKCRHLSSVKALESCLNNRCWASDEVTPTINRSQSNVSQGTASR